MRFDDSNVSPNMPDFWILEAIDVDEISVCSHGVSLMFTTQQDDNLIIAALFFPEPSAELLESRMGLRGGTLHDELERLTARYDVLRGKIEQQFGSLFDQYGRVDFRPMTAETRPRLLDPHGRLALEWRGSVFELRGYLDVYFTQMM
jgi:hypothetical protein